eukprot:3762604-Ditylum_brightwellii.AAC.2
MEVLIPFYANNCTLDSNACGNACLMKVFVAHSPDRGYFPEPEKSIHVYDNPSSVDAARAAFEAKGLMVKFHDGHCYVGGFIGTKETELACWVQPKVET